ncbi:S-methyl-5'-thioinosine phosphorylase [Tersicoccus sp. MR15.9]|uniref:S-methyl-5'-thioinosine phosphorylase n=1 Tax=Tersicoccus mangrovi TaxID=3121635 RepID=UPI002FE5CB90
MSEAQPVLGVIGGSGLYRLPGADVIDSRRVETPYGATSAPVTLARLGGREIAFLPRHGTTHALPPHRINYRANLWALASLGVEAVLSSAAVGSLSPDHRPGQFAVVTDVLDRTSGRADTFYDGTNDAGVQHLQTTQVWCPHLRAALIRALNRHDEDHRDRAVLAVINGPRFTSEAESAWLRSAGADLVSMTQYPEAVLAAELNLGYATLAYVTDADTGHDGSEPVSAQLVFDRLAAAQERVLAVLGTVAADWEEPYRSPRAMDPQAVARVLAQPVVAA